MSDYYIYNEHVVNTCGQREMRLRHKSLHKLYLYFQHSRCTRAGFQTKFIPVLSVFGVILVADVLHYQVSLFGLMKVVSL